MHVCSLCVPAWRERRLRLLNDMDLDGDGSVSRAEFIEWFANEGEEHHDGPAAHHNSCRWLSVRHQVGTLVIALCVRPLSPPWCNTTTGLALRTKRNPCRGGSPVLAPLLLSARRYRRWRAGGRAELDAKRRILAKARCDTDSDIYAASLKHLRSCALAPLPRGQS